MANLACENELKQLNCDHFFKDEEQKKEFARTCPPSAREALLNGYDLGLICAQQIVKPTVDSLKATYRFIADGIRKSQENREKFIAVCELDPSFKTTTAKALPIFSNSSQKDIEKIPCSYLVAELEEYSSRQRELHAGERAEAATRLFLSTPRNDATNPDVENPLQSLLRYNREKWPCLNQAGHYQLSCYEFFSVVDPTVLISTTPKVVRLVGLFQNARRVTAATTKAGEIQEAAHLATTVAAPKIVEPQILNFQSGMGGNLDRSINTVPVTTLNDGIKNSGLDQKFLNNINSRSAGAISLRDYLRQPNAEGATALGISRPEIYRAISDEKSLERWGTAYSRLGIETNEFRHTDKFMNAITSGDHKVVMFVPNEVLTHKLDSVTRAEIQWLQAHPERLKNVQFVFGAYDPATSGVEQSFYELHLNERKRLDVLRKLLQEIRK